MAIRKYINGLSTISLTNPTTSERACESIMNRTSNISKQNTSYPFKSRHLPFCQEKVNVFAEQIQNYHNNLHDKQTTKKERY